MSIKKVYSCQILFTKNPKLLVTKLLMNEKAFLRLPGTNNCTKHFPSMANGKNNAFYSICKGEKELMKSITQNMYVQYYQI